MIILASDGISETKRCQHEADHCYQSFNRQHPLSPPFPDSLSGFYVNGGSQSFRGGLTAYHPGSPKEILSHSDRNFNRIHFGVGKVAGSIFNIVSTSRRYKKDWKTFILSGFQSKCPLFKLGVSFVVLNCICLGFMQIYAFFTSITSIILAYWFSVAKMLPRYSNKIYLRCLFNTVSIN